MIECLYQQGSVLREGNEPVLSCALDGKGRFFPPSLSLSRSVRTAPPATADDDPPEELNFPPEGCSN